MAASTSPIGQLFRTGFALPGLAGKDSARFRSRLDAAYRRYVSNELNSDAIVASDLTINVGIAIPRYSATGGYNFSEFIANGEIQDVLSFITIAFRFAKKRPGDAAKQWRDQVARMLGEENLLYEIDLEGGVVPRIDALFVAGVRSAIAALDDPKYGGAKAAFEAGHAQLTALPPDYKGAVRDLFEATEAVIKSRVGGDLTVTDLQSKLRPLVEKTYQAIDNGTHQTAMRFYESFVKWVACANPYRHGHDAETPVSPPDELAVAQFSAGAAYL